MKTKQVIKRNIAVIFNEDVNDLFIKLSKQINRVVPSKVSLNMEDMIPHMTIYSTNFPKRNHEMIEANLEKIAQNTKPFHIRFTSKSVVAGTIFVSADISDELQAFHEKLIKVLNSLRDGLFNENELHLPGTTKKMKEYLRKYGMILVMDEFQPHVTVARPADYLRCEEALNILPNKLDIFTKVDSISLVESGPNGTCRRILNTFELNQHYD